ncbi:MAG: tetratricopeptide repeat protein [Phycisphaerae bacterium]|nr:tetratricopeptide repeat protein [Phycisphaerae bacterium]
MFRSFISLFLFVSIFSLCSPSFAETIVPSEEAHKLYAAANRLEESKKFEEAKALYQQVLQQYPNSEFAAGAKLHFSRFNVLSQIAASNRTGAETEINNIEANYPSHPDFAWYLYGIANQYEEMKKYKEARELYQKILQQHPNSPVAAGARLHYSRFNVLEQIASGNRTASENEIINIESDFKNHPDFPWYIYSVANQYEEQKRYEEARVIYNKILQKYPDSPVAPGAKLHLARFEVGSMIDSGDANNADTAINQLAESFPNHPDMQYFLSEMAYHYDMAAKNDGREESSEYLRKSALLYETAAGKADTNETALLYCLAGERFHKVADYLRSAECYLKVVDKYPDYPLVWHAMYMAGDSYQYLKKTGQLSKSQADTKTKTLFSRLVAEYPDCAAAKAVSEWNRKNTR